MITQKLERELQGILGDLDRGAEYLLRDDVAGIAHETKHPNGSDHTICNPACLESCAGKVEHVSVMSKHYGSNITGVYEGRRRLNQLLERIAEERKSKNEPA